MFKNLMLLLSMSIYLMKSLTVINNIGKMKDRDKADALISKVAREWGQKLIKEAGGEVVVIGREILNNASTVCFISNHQSLFDIPLILGYIDKPKAFLAKIEILKVPILSKWMQLMHCVFIDRKNIRQSVKAIREATQNLTNGYSMVVFPEGTRGEQGKLGEFKHGGFKMAVSSGVPIVPISIDGAYKFFEGKKKGTGKVKVRLVIGNQIETRGLSKQEISELPDKVRGVIESNLTDVNLININ